MVKPEEVVGNFTFAGRYAGCEPYKKGHINDTFIVSSEKDNSDKHRYILQRINGKVFRDPAAVMENIEKVTTHLRKKITENGGNPRREALTIIPTTEGDSYHKTSGEDYWRAYDYIEKARSYHLVENPLHFYNAGKTIGKFQSLLADFPVDDLHETIRDFHNTPKRFTDFIKAVEYDIVNRAKTARDEITFAEKRGGEVSVLVNLFHERRLPLRVIHNDTKFNNVLIDDETGEGVCLVDLDTVMPGLSLYDFGDAIRFGASTAEEDEPDLSRVSMDMVLFEEFCRGYLQNAGCFLEPAEVEKLPFSAWLITLECGMRFLTDYLNGDTYFKTHRKNHNLDRARTQFKLVRDMEIKYEKMANAVEKCR